MRPRTASTPLAAFGLTALLGASAGCTLNPVVRVFGTTEDSSYLEMAKTTPETEHVMGVIRQTSSITKADEDGTHDRFEFYVEHENKAYFCRCEGRRVPEWISLDVAVEFPAKPVGKQHGVPVYDGCRVSPSAPSSTSR